MSADDTSATIAAVAADVHTVGQARATLGRTSELLADAYTRLPDITGADNRDAARELLDQANDYAQRVYGELPNADADQAIDATTALRVGGAFGTTRRALRRVEEAADQTYWDYAGALRDTLTMAGSAAGDAVQSVTNAVAAGGAAFLASAWPTVLLIGAAVALYIFGPRLLARVR
jgi:hypothetical protein